MADDAGISLTELTVDLLAAFVSNNSVRSEDLPGLITSTHAALASLGDDASGPDASSGNFTPAVSARKSLASREHIVSMIDGKAYRTLKRHLSTHGLTPAEYRARYGLPASYPMVAPAYSDQRRQMAKKIGLGRTSDTARRGAGRKAGRG